MSYTILVLPEAENDIDNAYWWYEEQQVGIGDVFLQELIDCYTIIAKNPTNFGWYDAYHRRAILKKFPFVVIYEVFTHDIVINSVFHTSRNPKELP